MYRVVMDGRLFRVMKREAWSSCCSYVRTATGIKRHWKSSKAAEKWIQQQLRKGK